MRRDFLNVGILWFILTFAAELILPTLNIFPLASAEEAVLSDESFYILLVLGLPVFTLVVAVMIYSLIFFRASKSNILEAGTPIHGHTLFSLVWLGVTGGLCLTVIVHPGLTGLAKFQGNRTADLVVKVTGRQWAWDIAYPAYNVSNVNELALPVNQRVKFEIASTDVLHSFWIPAFRDKIDAVPGRVTEMYITPNKLGSTQEDAMLRVQCAEICGMGHAPMAMPVKVVSANDFKKWIADHAAAADAVTRGAAVAKAKGCTACHSIDGTVVVGPSWKNVYGEKVELEGGATATADEAYLTESILEPNAKIVKGFKPDLMPKAIGTSLTKDELSDVIAYIKSLSPNGK